MGLAPLSGGRKFVDEIFDPKAGLYEPIELTDVLGTRFLVRQGGRRAAARADTRPGGHGGHCRLENEQARPLAKKAATDLASQIKAKGADRQRSQGQRFQVMTIPPITRSQMNFA